MSEIKTIHIVCAVILDSAGKMLLVRKRGTQIFIQPGGKLNPGETSTEALRRTLQGHPIYSLKGDGARSALAKLAVRDVRVVDGKVRVTFLRFGA